MKPLFGYINLTIHICSVKQNTHTMNALNYTRLMALNPTKYGDVVNQLGQTVEFYEHPTRGDEHPVIAVIHELSVAYVTDFYDTEDFYEGSEYNPVYAHGEMLCAWEADL
jgi:hypothetical protein